MGRFAAKIIANATARLDPGEEVQGAFAAQPGPVFRAHDTYRVVVATDRRLLVFASGTFSQTKVRDLLAELPRGVRLGEPSGLWHTLPDELDRHVVNRRYFEQLRRIDAGRPG